MCHETREPRSELLTEIKRLGQNLTRNKMCVCRIFHDKCLMCRCKCMWSPIGLETSWKKEHDDGDCQPRQTFAEIHMSCLQTFFFCVSGNVCKLGNWMVDDPYLHFQRQSSKECCEERRIGGCLRHLQTRHFVTARTSCSFF